MAEALVPSRIYCALRGCAAWLMTEMLLLALRTIVRSPAADHDLFDRRFAGQAGLAFASIGAVLDLEEAGFAIGVNVIGNG